MELHPSESGGSVLLIVDAMDASVIYATATTRGIVARATVFPLRGDQPKAEVTWPLALAQYPAGSRTPLPADFPDPWIASGQTSGNAVTAVDAGSGTPVDGVLSGGTVVFDIPDGDTRQRVVNCFHYCCLLHDLYYILGFREIDGNFQVDGLGRGGVAGDAVLATAYPGTVSATANMTTPKDGSSPRLNVGLLTSTGRHTALDATVVFHEFSHGLTSRLIGGPLNAVSLLAPQSAGMSEGWSDYFACVIADTTVIGAWVADKPGGIRRQPYDEGTHPGTFADLGTAGFRNAHQIGELWCSVLMEFDRGVGSALALQVVVDSLKLAPANPSFLDMRDAMGRAVDAMRDAGMLTATQHRATTDTLLKVFAMFGMGPSATCDGAQLTGVRADFSLRGPVHAQASATARPNLPIPDKDSRGVTSGIDLDADGNVVGLSVAVDVAHEFRGDLQVTLTSPVGTAVVLRTPDDDPHADLITNYDLGSAPALAAFVGQPVRGRWMLKVADLQRLSTGTLRSWTVTVMSQ
jgi:extracellular elastinolytic metalloproteinase